MASAKNDRLPMPWLSETCSSTPPTIAPSRFEPSAAADAAPWGTPRNDEENTNPEQKKGAESE